MKGMVLASSESKDEPNSKDMISENEVSALQRYKEKVEPPTWQIDPSKLKVGDHIYRRLQGWKKYFGYHHGVVTSISNNIAINHKTTQTDPKPMECEEAKPYWCYLESSMIQVTEQKEEKHSLFVVHLHKKGIYGKWSTAPYICTIDANANFSVHNSAHFKQVLARTYVPLRHCGVDINYASKEIAIKYFKSTDEVFVFSFRHPAEGSDDDWVTCVNVLQQQSGSCKQHLLLNIKVIEMTVDHGIREVSLSTFLEGDDCRLVYYNTHKMYERLHAAGTCHYEPSSPLSEVLKRVQLSRLRFLNDRQLYNLYSSNCEELAIWIKTGMFRGTRMSQLQAAENKVRNCIQAVEDGVTSAGSTGINIARQLFKYGSTAVDDIATETLKTGLKKGNMVSALGVDVAENGAIKAMTGTGAAAACGIAFGIEAGISVYKIHKYKTDYRYTKCDLYRDLGRGWTVTLVTTGVGIGCAALAFGWWAILPTIGVGLLLNFVLQHWKVWDKPLKEKLYKEYKLNKDSSVAEMKRVRRNLKRQLRNERLHPDKWESTLSEKEKKKKMEKFLWMQQILDFLDEDIGTGCVTFETESKKTIQPQAIAL